MNKKIIIIIIIFILAVTGLVFLLKYQGLIRPPKVQPPVVKKEEPATIKIKPVSIVGSVVSINDKELVILTGDGEVNLDITSEPSTYMMEKEKRIDKKVIDLKAGSLVKIHYLDNGVKKAPLVIFIDKL